MNCKQCQERMLESLVTGDLQIARELAAHQELCAICQHYYEVQSHLFRSMDAGLRAAANEKVPPSLIPAVRSRLEQQPVPGTAWLPSWSFALVATLVLLVMGIGYVRHRPESQPRFSEGASVTSRSVANAETPALPSQKAMTVRPHRKSKLTSSTNLSPAAPEAAPEVIVLAEERQAFARFVSELPEEKDVALALTRLAPVVQDDLVEIALLQIDSLEVKPMESTARE
jgi:hypothetical protein